MRGVGWGEELGADKTGREKGLEGSQWCFKVSEMNRGEAVGRWRRGLRLKGLETELGGVLGKEVRTDGEVRHFRHGEQGQKHTWKEGEKCRNRCSKRGRERQI